MNVRLRNATLLRPQQLHETWRGRHGEHRATPAFYTRALSPRRYARVAFSLPLSSRIASGPGGCHDELVRGRLLTAGARRAVCRRRAVHRRLPGVAAPGAGAEAKRPERHHHADDARQRSVDEAGEITRLRAVVAPALQTDCRQSDASGADRSGAAAQSG